MNVLICTQDPKNDPHVMEVSEIIRAKGYAPIYFERYRSDHSISYTYHRGKFSTHLMIKGKSYDLSKSPFYSIWWRIKPSIKSEIPGAEGDIKEKFCMLEWRQALNALSAALPEAKWVNPLTESLAINNKITQLKLANECGLQTPNTIITNNWDNVIAFLRKEKRIIYKTLSSFFTEKEAIFTTEITYEMLQKDPNAVRMAPGIFQRLIEKAYELRVMIVGEKVFVLKINSQKYEKAKLDWRRTQAEEMFCPGELSIKTTQSLLKYHKVSGLVYAAYDFIVDKEGNEIFLEINPSGQWVLGKKHSFSELFAEELIY